MEETRTRLCEAMPASRRANSKELKRSLCLPTPLVKNILLGTMLFPNFYVSSVGVKIVALANGSRMSLTHFDGRQAGFWAFCQPLVRINPPAGVCSGQDNYEPSRFVGRISGFQQRVDPSQPRKAGKIAVVCVEHTTTFNGQRRQSRVACQLSAHIPLQQHLMEEPPVIFSRRNDPHMGIFEPLFNDSERLRHRKTLA